MSTFVALTREVSTQLIQANPMSAPLDAGQQDGLLDWATTKNSETQTLMRAVSITAAIVFVIWQAVASRMAMARVIISGVSAGLLVWMVFNVTDVSDRVDNEVNSLPSPPTVTQLFGHPDQVVT